MSVPIRVVVADDSAFIRGLIAGYLESAGGFEVVGMADDGLPAIELVQQLRPDVVTLDVEMPTMSGLEALERIMRESPTPVVMVSGVSIRSAETTLKAIQSGAIDFVLKFVPGECLHPDEIRLDVIAKVRAAAGVRVVRSLNHVLEPVKTTTTPRLPTPIAPPCTESRRIPTNERSTGTDTHRSGVRELVVVGASTGGPMAIKQFLRHLPPTFDGAILVVQHIPQPFTSVLAAQFTAQTSFTAEVVKGGEPLQRRRVYIAPGDRHLLLSPSLRLETQAGPPVRGNMPSIDITMKSVAQYFPHRIYGVLLTGMGDDGASGLAYIQSKGGTTYAQSAETCVVNGMPQSAIQLGAVQYVASPEGIAEQLTQDSARTPALATLADASYSSLTSDREVFRRN